VGCFGGHGLPKASQQLGLSEEIPHEISGIDPPGDGACRDSRVAGASQGSHRGRGRPFWVVLGIIINKNLKLLLINYLARKMDVLFHFPSMSQYTWDRTYGMTVYFNLTRRFILPPYWIYFLWFSHWIIVSFLNGINQLISVPESEYVFCEVGF